MLDLYREFKDFKAFEIVFQDGEGSSHTIFCTIKSIENNSLIVNADNKRNKNKFANEGDDLKLYIYTDNGIYSANSTVISVERGVSSAEYTIEYPTDSKHSQRREYFRADLNIPFKLHIFSGDDEIETSELDGKTKNICGKGMCYVASKPFPEHDKIILDLQFTEKTLSTQASFVYSKQIVEGNQPKFIHAFAFSTISAKDVDFIVKKCFLYQLELRKRL